MRLPVIVLALAACGEPPRPVAAANAAPPAPLGPVPPGAPFVGFHDSAFQLVGLPAAARLGEVVAIAHVETDGGRGYPNLRLEIRDRADKVVQAIPVMTSNEYEQLAPGGVPGKVLGDRVAEANRLLGMHHALHHLQPMHELALQPATDGGDAHIAMGDSFDVDWSKDHLHVFHHNSQHPLATVDGTPWLVKDSPLGAGGDTCHNPAYLRKVFHAPDVNLLVVDIAYHGTDTCWEPGDQLHVVAW